MTKIFLLSYKIAFINLIKLDLKNILKKLGIYIFLKKFHPTNLFLTTCIKKKKLQNIFFI